MSELRYRLVSIWVDEITKIDGDDFYYGNNNFMISKKELKNWRNFFKPKIGDYIWHKCAVEDDTIEHFICCNKQEFDKHSFRRDLIDNLMEKIDA
jgi:hypothetical protein